MSSSCVVGLQWGDEAKGKIVDVLCDEHDVVVRYQGGANAGHTIAFGGRTFKLSLVPTGILRPAVTAVIGNGVVIHPGMLLRELETLRNQGIDIGDRLKISDRAHVIMPYHLVEERLTEESDSALNRLGTTRRGIGPCYRDKVGRVHGIRVADLFDPPRFREQLQRVLTFKNAMLAATLSDYEAIRPEDILVEYLEFAERLKPYVEDTTAWLHNALERGQRLLFEGAQGTLLDIDHGSYPYVTSSNSSSAGIASGSGVPSRWIDRWVGIVKAYTTRVGGGPFPTEQDNETGERIRQVGREFGTVTGRPRRCGWFDAVAARYAARISGATEICVMLLDVLTGLPTIEVGIAYEDDGGRRIETLPGSLTTWEKCRPVYARLPGWTADLREMTHWNELPLQARDYVRFLSEVVGVPVSMVSVGPERRQTIRVPTDPRDGFAR